MTAAPLVEPAATTRYRAFLSYSQHDAAVAAALHRRLEAYRVPRALLGRRTGAGPVPRRVFPVFRDRDELPTASDLGAVIRAALDASAALVVVCSPRAAASRYVDQEIRWFRRVDRARPVLAIVVDGEPNAARPEDECFPPSLRGSEGGVEPLAADLRPGRDGPRNAFLKLVAGLLDLSLDDLRRRDRARRRRRQALLAGAAALVVVSGVAVGGVLAEERARARRSEGKVGVLEREVTQRGREAVEASEAATRAEAETVAKEAERAAAEARRKQAEAERAAEEARASEASEAAMRAKAETAAKEAERVAAEVRRSEEEAARKVAQARAAIGRAVALLEGGKSRDALREAFAAYALDSGAPAAQVLLARLLGDRGPVVSESALPMTGVDGMWRASASADALWVSAQRTDYLPVALLWILDSGPLGPPVGGVKPSRQSVLVDGDARRLVTVESPFAGTPNGRLWRSGVAEPLPLVAAGASPLWAALSRDGSLVALSRPGELHVVVVDAASGDGVATIPGMAAAGAFVGDGQRLALSRFSKGVDVVDARSGAPRGHIDTGEAMPGAVLAVAGDVVVFDSVSAGPLLVDVERLAVTARMGRRAVPPRVEISSGEAPFVLEDDSTSGAVVRAWDVRTGRVLRTIASEAGAAIQSAAIRPGRRQVVVHTLDAAARLYDVDGNRAPREFAAVEVRTLATPSGLPVPSPFDASGTRLLGLAESGFARVWDADDGRLRCELRVAPTAVGACLSRDGAFLDVVTKDGRTERWRVPGATPAPSSWSRELAGTLFAAAISPDGARLARANEAGLVTVSNVADGSLAWERTVADGQVWSIAFSGDGRHLVVAPRYRQPAHVLDARTGKELRSLAVRTPSPGAHLSTPDAELVLLATLPPADEVVTYGSNGVHQWDCATGKKKATWEPFGESGEAWPSEDGSAVLVTHESAPPVVLRRVGDAWTSSPPLPAGEPGSRWLGVHGREGLAFRTASPNHVEAIDVATATARWSVTTGEPAIARAALLADGRVAALRADGSLTLLAPADGREVVALPPRADSSVGVGLPGLPLPPSDFELPSARHLALDASGDLLGVSPPGGGCWLVDVRSGAVVLRLGGDEAEGFVGFGDEGRVLVRVTSSRIEGTRIERERRPVELLRAEVERLTR